MNGVRERKLVDSFRQVDQNQSVGNYVPLFEVHITLEFEFEVSTFISLSFYTLIETEQ